MRGRIIGLGEVLKLERWTKQCTIENKDMNLTLYLAHDVVGLIDVDSLPANIEMFAGIPEF
jgi:hypothetical protein